MKKLLIIALVLIGIQAPAFANGLQHDPGLTAGGAISFLMNSTGGAVTEEGLRLKMEQFVDYALEEFSSDKYETSADSLENLLYKVGYFDNATTIEVKVAAFKEIFDYVKVLAITNNPRDNGSRQGW